MVRSLKPVLIGLAALLLAACDAGDPNMDPARKAQLIAQRVEELSKLAAERGVKLSEEYFREVCGSVPSIEWDIAQIEAWTKECAGHITQRLGQEMVKSTAELRSN